MSKKVIIIIAAVSVLFLGIIGGGFFFIWTQMSAMVAQAKAPATAEEPVEEENKIGPLFPMETMIVNLADEGGKRYLRTTMQLELSDQEVVSEIETRLPQIKDSILMVLPTRKYRDVNTTEGKIALRDELIVKLNEFFSKGEVTNIYFTEFVIQ